MGALFYMQPIRRGRIRFRVAVVLFAATCVPLVGGCDRGTGGVGNDGGSGNRNVNQNSGARLDSDQDDFVNAEDNCPATANADQADDDGDGVGDACAAPFADHVTTATEEGTVELRLDERRRPALLVGPSAQASFAWTDDSASAEVSSAGAERSFAFTLTPDFSDEAILAALDELAADTGADVSLTRDWIADHPGTVGAIVSGTQTLRIRAPDVGAADAERKDRSALIRQAANQAVEEHIFGLQVAFAVVTNTADSLGDAWRGAGGDLADHLWDVHWSMVRLEWFLQDLLENQVGACVNPCTLACQVDCTIPGAGACCTLEDGAPCVDADAEACAARAGTFWDGFTCADVVCPCEEVECGSVEWGACVMQFGAVSTCGQSARSTCEIIGQFYPATPCAQVDSPDGACVYTTPEGRLHCADAEPDQCDLLLHGAYQAGIYCASGACYYLIDEGVIGCAHLSRIDCDNLYVEGVQQVTDFHADALCVGSAP